MTARSGDCCQVQARRQHNDRDEIDTRRKGRFKVGRESAGDKHRKYAIAGGQILGIRLLPPELSGLSGLLQKKRGGRGEASRHNSSAIKTRSPNKDAWDAGSMGCWTTRELPRLRKIGPSVIAG